MKEEKPDLISQNSFSCPLYAQCLNLVDELADRISLSSTFDVPQDYECPPLIQELHTHIRTCLICSAAVMHAYDIRTQQRNLIHDWLSGGENQVPSTITN